MSQDQSFDSTGDRMDEEKKSRKFDAPGLSFSMEDSAFESILTEKVQRNPQTACSPFYSSIERTRRHSEQKHAVEDTPVQKQSSSTTRRNTFGVTATNIFNLLYAYEEERTAETSSQGTFITSASGTNTRSTIGDSTVTDTVSTASGTASGLTNSQIYTGHSFADTSGTETNFTYDNTSGYDTATASGTYNTHEYTKSTAADTGTRRDSISSFSQSRLSEATTVVMHSPRSKQAYIDPVQQALDDLVSTPIPSVTHARVRRGVLKHPATKSQDKPQGMDELDALAISRDDTSSARATIARSEIDRSATEDIDAIEIERKPSSVGPPVLHRFCLTVERPCDLRKAKNLITAKAASEVDAIGRLPMHCLSDNVGLAEAVADPSLLHDEFSTPVLKSYRVSSPMSHSSQTTRRRSNRSGANSERNCGHGQTTSLEELKEAVIDFTVNGLLKMYPASMISLDGDDHIPFEAALSEWVELSLEVPDESTPGDRKRKFSAEQFTSVSALWNRSLGNSPFWKKNFGSSRGAEQQLNARSISTERTGGHRDVEIGKQRLQANSRDTHTDSDQYFPSDVKLTSPVNFSLITLSAILDALDGSASTVRDSSFKPPTLSLRNGDQSQTDSSLEALKDTTAADIRSEIVHTISSISGLLKVVLLIENDEHRDFVMSTALMKSVIAHPSSVGPWLTHMLQSGQDLVVQRALEYVDLVSSDLFWSDPILSAQKDRRGGTTNRREAVLDKRRVALYDHVSQLPDFVPSLLSLHGRQIEEASTTTMIRSVLDRIMARPFCASFIFFDGFFLATMIVGFRMAVHRFIMRESQTTILSLIYIANMGIFYFAIRELGKAVSLSMINHRARVYLLSFWNASDLLTTLLTLISTVAIRSDFSREKLTNESIATIPYPLRYLLTITTGFLWLRVLSFLKGINMQLATFVLAILQISRDVFWFCVIVLTLLVSFGQMFFTLMAPETCGMEPEIATCRQTEYYMKVYAMLIFQEFDRDSYDSFVSVVLVVVYSFLVALLLLNVLIAVASDSYEKCLLRSQHLFGRARVMMISEMVAFQHLLRRHSGEVSALAIYKTWWSQDAAAGWSRASLVFFGLSSIVLVCWILAEMAGYATGPGHGNMAMSLGSILATALLFVSIMFFLSVGAGNNSSLFKRKGRRAYDGRVAKFAAHIESLVQSFVLRVVSTSSKVNSNGVSGASTSEDDWSGRIHFLTKEMNRLAEQQSASTSLQVENLEASLREELANMKSSLVTLREEVAKPNAVSPEDIPAMLGVAIEALQRVQKTMR